MRLSIFLLIWLTLILPGAGHSQGLDIKITDESIQNGKALYMAHCLSCHSLKFYRGPESMAGLQSPLDPQSAASAFGAVPPDLSLMAASRGRGKDGARYIIKLLTTYYLDEQGNIKNKAFAEETQTEGAIAMPPPIPMDDPQLTQKSHDIAVFLFAVAQPELEDRTRTGFYVIAYMALLTITLFALNRLTWKKLKKSFRP